MKKSVLIFALVFLMLAGSVALQATASPGNLLGAGWDFESGLDILGTPDGGAYEGDKYYAGGGGLVSIVEGGYSSAHALLVEGIDIGNGKTIDGLNPNTDYVLSFWCKADISGGGFPLIGMKEYGPQGKYEVIMHSDWQKYEINFKTGASNTSALFYTWIYNGLAKFYVDDVVLSEFTGTKPVTYRFECEDNFKAADIGGVPSDIFVNSSQADSASGGVFHGLQLADADSGWAEYAIEVPASGNYLLDVGIARLPNAGKFQTYVDGVKLGAVIDQYYIAPGFHFTTVTAGKVSLTAGTHIIRFELAGWDASAASSHILRFDFIDLTVDTAATSNGSVKTGDTATIILFAALCTICVLGCGFGVYARNRKEVV